MPRISADVICEVFNEIGVDQIFTQLWKLNEYSLIAQSEGGYYKILAIVSSTFRRFTDQQDDELLKRVALVLKKRFDSGELTVDLIDSLLIGMVNLEGELPTELREVVTPARLLAVVEEQYNRGMRGTAEDVSVHFRLAGKLSELALSMPCPDDTLENILFLGADSMVRSGEYPTQLLDVMFKKAFSSAHYIEGSYLFHRERKYDEAAKQIELALRAGHFLRRSIRLLARIYLRIGRFRQAVEALDRLGNERLLRDTGLVVMKIRALRALRRSEEARELEAQIGNVDDEFGSVAIYDTGQALREGDLARAKQNLAKAQRAPKSNNVTLKFLECAIAIESKDYSHLPEACALANRAGREADARQLLARAAVVQEDWKAAEGLLAQIESKDYFDLQVELRMLELKLADPEVLRDPAATRDASSRKEEVLREAAGTVEGSRF